MRVRVFKDAEGRAYPVLLHETYGRVTRCWIQVDGEEVQLDVQTFAFDGLETVIVRLD